MISERTTLCNTHQPVGTFMQNAPLIILGKTKSASQHDYNIHLTSQFLSTSLAWYVIAAAAQWHFLCLPCHVPCQRITENS